MKRTYLESCPTLTMCRLQKHDSNADDIVHAAGYYGAFLTEKSGDMLSCLHIAEAH